MNQTKMPKKRKSETPGLEDVEKTLFSSFCSAANSLSQLYSQAQNQQRVSFQSGERHALARLQHWLTSEESNGGSTPGMVSKEQVLDFIQGELDRMEETPPLNNVTSAPRASNPSSALFASLSGSPAPLLSQLDRCHIRPRGSSGASAGASETGVRTRLAQQAQQPLGARMQEPAALLPQRQPSLQGLTSQLQQDHQVQSGQCQQQIHLSGRAGLATSALQPAGAVSLAACHDGQSDDGPPTGSVAGRDQFAHSSHLTHAGPCIQQQQQQQRYHLQEDLHYTQNQNYQQQGVQAYGYTTGLGYGMAADAANMDT